MRAVTTGAAGGRTNRCCRSSRACRTPRLHRGRLGGVLRVLLEGVEVQAKDALVLAGRLHGASTTDARRRGHCEDIRTPCAAHRRPLRGPGHEHSPDPRPARRDASGGDRARGTPRRPRGMDPHRSRHGRRPRTFIAHETLRVAGDEPCCAELPATFARPSGLRRRSSGRRTTRPLGCRG